MSAPIPDAPPPAVQDAASSGVGFSPGPPVASLCGFSIPSFLLNLTPRLPSFGLPLPLPIPTLAIGLNCDLNNPIAVATGFGPGGGRKASFDRDPDEDFD